MTKKTKRAGFNPAIYIDGGKGSEHTRYVVEELSKHLGRAIELGREGVAIEITKALSDTAGVKGASVMNCVFNGGAK